MVMAAVLGGAFAGGLADRMKENREYTKTKSDEMQAFLVQTGLKRRNEVAKARRGLTEAVDYLGSKGLEESNLLALLDQNPKEVIRLYGAALKAEARGDLTSTLLNQAVIASEGYTAPDMTPSELIKTATPDFIQGTDLKKPEEREGSVLNKMFRSPDLKEIMYDAYSSDILGVKGKDIQASMTADLLKSGTEGPSRANVDIGPLATDKYDGTMKREMRSQIRTLYNDELDNQIDATLTYLDKNLTNIQRDTAEKRQKDLREIKKDIAEGRKNSAYQKLILMYPEIAQDFYQTGGLGRNVLSNPDYFSFSEEELEELFGGN